MIAGVVVLTALGTKHQRTADPRSMDALDPSKRMPRQQRRARKAAFREVDEQERSQRDANQQR